ncbi:DUF2057 family protein [Vibrio sp. 10N.222.54.A1]|uniref:DUF2057 family protein n=1 Tax=Vibrio TaxID=662 RepID=UPI0002FD5B88|nr:MULTISPECIES: DUF2057 family protein [Vibrio]ANP76133.1 hypothetical protein A134_06890 [Vibrio crassostreae 9CS106]NOH91116.1 DUF2057 domain-containing protein [Vibrio sp. AIC-3]OCH49940.1 hypothetical protein A6D97_05610 [Vibrio sp. ZF57]OED73710.1 hypothetical protein A141_08335 [Vibrio crassostreae ZF-91]OEE99979.1 hypothetical protein A136_17560 [Vibrio crassostreae 9ZC13]
MQSFKYSFLGLLVASTVVDAEVILDVPENVNLLSVNMSVPDFEQGLFSADKTVLLPDGENQIVFQYEPVFDERDNQRKVYSSVIIAKFEAKNEELTLSMPEFKNLRSAQENIGNLNWEIKNKQGQALIKNEDILASDGVQLNRSYSEEATEYNKVGGAAAVTMSYLVVENQVRPAVKVNATSLEENTLVNAEGLTANTSAQVVDKSESLKQLKALYLSTSKEDRKVFRKWMIDQE